MLNDENYDMDGYLESAEEIARKKLNMYSELLRNIESFKKEYKSPNQRKNWTEEEKEEEAESELNENWKELLEVKENPTRSGF